MNKLAIDRGASWKHYRSQKAFLAAVKRFTANGTLITSYPEEPDRFAAILVRSSK